MDGFEIILGAAREVRDRRDEVIGRRDVAAHGGGRIGGSLGGRNVEGLPNDVDASAAGEGRARLSVVRVDAEGFGAAMPHARRPGIANARPGRSARNARASLDVFVGGVNVTARVDADQAPCVLRDLALAVLDLACGVRERAIVRFYDGPWELGLRRVTGVGDDSAESVAISVVRTGDTTEVAVHDRRARLDQVLRGTRVAIDALLASEASMLPSPLAAELRASRDSIARMEQREVDRDRREPACDREVSAIVEAEPGAVLAFAGEQPLVVATPRRAGSRADGDEASVEVADVHALLGRGRARLIVRGRVHELGEVHTFLFAERLIDVARALLDAWGRGCALARRFDLGGPVARVDLATVGTMALSIGADVSMQPEDAEVARGSVHPALEAPDVIDGMVTFGRALVRAIVRRDRAQAQNLRLLALRRSSRELGERLRTIARPVGPFGESDLVNTSDERYRRYLQVDARAGVSIARSDAASSPSASSIPPLRSLKFSPRWTAEVPGIDLRATFLCGDRLILSGTSQTACVDRDEGRTIWQVAAVRATSLPTPGGLARIRADGRLELRDFGDGSVVWTQPCAPRSKGTPAACTIAAPGLPRLLLATDGDRHLVAHDLTSGAPRWRYALSKPGPIRMRRAGRLVVVTSDEASLTALDVVDGRVVWRVRDRLRFSAPPSVEREDLVAIAGEPSGAARLHVIDASSGKRRWERPLFFSAAADCAPMLFADLIVVVARDRRGLGFGAFDRVSGVERWAVVAGAFPVGTAVMAIDDAIVLNLPTGETLAIDVATGKTRWRHIFEAPFQGDAPRRLDPVLRSGALFVPQDKVRVMRPSDGAILGVIGPCDLVPDLMRVDERGDAYLAEESGHVAAFTAATKLVAAPPVSTRGGANGRGNTAPISGRSHLSLVK